jgi:hypothetical protein
MHARRNTPGIRIGLAARKESSWSLKRLGPRLRGDERLVSARLSRPDVGVPGAGLANLSAFSFFRRPPEKSTSRRS